MNGHVVKRESAKGIRWNASSSARSAPPSSSVPACLAEQFPHFDLSVLSDKQLAVVEMRLCGGLSWRKIAAFEAVTSRAVRFRFALAVERLSSAADSPTHA